MTEERDPKGARTSSSGLPRGADALEAKQIAYWNAQTATSWTAFQDRIDALFAPITALAIDAASPRPGERALDIGSGCGGTVLDLAQRVGPRGHVLGIDVSRPMSDRAAQRIAAAGAANAEVVVADAATYQFAPADRDLLFSRFGVMFFAEPIAALANLRRATRDGGRLEWIVWRHLGENPFFAVPLQAAASLLPIAPPADPLAPGPFAFADAERAEHLLRSAGWRNAELHSHDVPLRLGTADEASMAAQLVTHMGPLSRRLLADEREPGQQAAVYHNIEEALSKHVGADGITLVAAIWLVSAEA